MTNKKLFLLFAVLVAALCFTSCKKKPADTPSNTTTSAPRLIFKFKFDSTQARLNNIGLPDTMPAGHAGQSPVFNGMSAHYIELAQTEFIALGSGDVLYKAPETTAGGSSAIDFDSSVVVGGGQTFFSIPISKVKPGSYQYLRVSLAYQNYDVKFVYSGTEYTGTVASFIGFDTYIRTFKPKTVPEIVNANKLQGFWAFETLGNVIQGQAPPGATTVPNPIFATSPIPQGSCVVTGPFNGGSLAITGKETEDITVTVSLSTNKSFEWKDHNANGLYEPTNGDTVVNMGIRGLIPYVQY